MTRTKRTKDKKNNNNKITKTGFYLPPNLLGCILKKLSFRGNTAEKEDKSDMLVLFFSNSQHVLFGAPFGRYICVALIYAAKSSYGFYIPF